MDSRYLRAKRQVNTADTCDETRVFTRNGRRFQDDRRRDLHRLQRRVVTGVTRITTGGLPPLWVIVLMYVVMQEFLWDYGPRQVYQFFVWLFIARA